MSKKSKVRKSILSSVIAVAMVSSLSFAPASASAAQESDKLATGQMASEAPEWAIDDDKDVQKGVFFPQAELPATYDLRSEGLVTPVKSQSPWGSCWAFAGTAAAEISILSASGKKYGAKADSTHMPIDLSERHMTYFALQPVTKSINPAQAGEGLHTFPATEEDMKDNPFAAVNTPFNAGGLPVFVTTLYSQGVGPLPENIFPYRGPAGVTTEEDYATHPAHLVKDTKEQITALAEQQGMTYEEFMRINAAAMGTTVENLFNMQKETIRTATSEATGTASYTKYDDWSIPEKTAQGYPNRLLSAGYVLKNGNVLPDYWKADKSIPELEGINAIKQELLNGRGVNIAYHADQSGTYTQSDEGKRNMYNQYTNEDLRINHGVCIVGWDDNYDANNFKTPAPGKGAWIAKNSWGSTKDAVKDSLGNLIGNKEYGFKDENGKYTGCFYLSYYDKTIKRSETMEFSSNLGSQGVFGTFQHDYLPSDNGFYKVPASSDVMSSANVFSSDKQRVLVKSVSTSTPEANMRVTFAIYELNDNASRPDDGKLLFRTSQNFEYGGFHRYDLDQPVTIEKNKKFSVVSTSSVIESNGSRLYSTSAARTTSKAASEYLATQGYKSSMYGTAVVNKGESYLFKNGKWEDWADYLEALPADAEVKEGLPSATRYIEACPVDNFSIKAYVEPAAETKTDIAKASVTVAKASYNNGKSVKPKVAVKLGGKTLKRGTDYTVSYLNNKNAGTGLVVIKGKGSYTGSVEKKFTISKVANTLKASGKSLLVPVKKNTIYAWQSAFSISKAQGTVTVQKVSGDAKIAVNKKTGALIVKSGLKKGATYTVKVKVNAAGNRNYRGVSKIVTLKIKAANKGTNSLLAKNKTITANANKVTSFTSYDAFSLSKAKGTVVLKKTAGDKKIVVNPKTGNVTVKPGLVKGKTYAVKVKIGATGNAYYRPAIRNVTLKVRVQ